MNADMQLNELSHSRTPPPSERSELAAIPSDWQIRRIGELGQVVRGGSPRPAGDPRYFNGSFIPWLTVAALTNLPDTTLYVSETFGYLTEEGAKLSRLLSPGTLILANSGATLGVAKILEVECCANDGIAAILDQRTADTAFLCYYLNTQTNRLRDVVATGNGQPNLNTALIRDISVPIPSRSEQRAIAEVLSDVDGMLGSLAALIAKKRAIKHAATQQLLTGRTRLAGFSEQWEVKRLGELAAITMGQSPDSKNYNRTGDGLPLVQGNADIENRRSISRVWTTQLTKEGRAGDLLLTVRAPVGAVGRISERCCLGRGVCSLRPNWDADFLFQALVFAESTWKVLEQGSTFTSANSTDVAAFAISTPSNPSEQSAIAAILSNMDSEIAALETRRDKTRAIKQGIMQQLLTGRVRLVVSTLVEGTV